MARCGLSAKCLSRLRSNILTITPGDLSLLLMSFKTSLTNLLSDILICLGNCVGPRKWSHDSSLNISLLNL